MPGRETIETIRELRKHQPNLEILAISGAVECTFCGWRACWALTIRCGSHPTSMRCWQK
jgi:hypothetical protein